MESETVEGAPNGDEIVLGGDFGCVLLSLIKIVSEAGGCGRAHPGGWNGTKMWCSVDARA